MAWTIDPAHTRVTFNVRHMMIAKVYGEFESFEGHVEFDEENPAASRVEVTIDAASINTRSADRDNHLRSADFLDVEHYPTITFTSRRVEPLNDNQARLTGGLTIRGVTREVTLDVTYTGIVRSPWGNESAGFSAYGTLNRTDWGLTWNKALEAGGVLVGEEITLDLQVELIRQPEAEAAQD